MAPDCTVAVFTASDRIKQLNAIDRDVVRLLQSAGLAVGALTAPVPTSDGDSSIQSVSVEQQKGSFAAATSCYFALVSSLDVRLRRQVYALEEADILPAEAFVKECQASLAVPLRASATAGGSSGPSSGQIGSGKGAITGGGLGSLDVGWLNSRNDRVGKDMEAELWDQAEQFVHDFEEGKASKEPPANIQREGNAAMVQISQAQHISERMEQT